MNLRELEIFETLSGQLVTAYDEMALLSKKSPGDAVNKFKLGFINTTLQGANDFLKDRRPYDNFTEFDLETLPTNSDVAFILSQYIQSFEKIRADNVVMRNLRWCWKLTATQVEGADAQGIIYRDTVKPRNLRE